MQLWFKQGKVAPRSHQIVALSTFFFTLFASSAQEEKNLSRAAEEGEKSRNFNFCSHVKVEHLQWFRHRDDVVSAMSAIRGENLFWFAVEKKNHQ